MFISFPMYVSLIILTVIMIILIIYLSLTADKSKEDSSDVFILSEDDSYPNSNFETMQSEHSSEVNESSDHLIDDQSQPHLTITQEITEPFILPYPKDNKF